MPRAIISPSVLASDLGRLTDECKRMIEGGAEWLHMGESCDLSNLWGFVDLTGGHRCNGWVRPSCPRFRDYTNNISRQFVPNITMGELLW